jgi:hypothetical protein
VRAGRDGRQLRAMVSMLRCSFRGGRHANGWFGHGSGRCLRRDVCRLEKRISVVDLLERSWPSGRVVLILDVTGVRPISERVVGLLRPPDRLRRLLNGAMSFGRLPRGSIRVAGGCPAGVWVGTRRGWTCLWRLRASGHRKDEPPCRDCQDGSVQGSSWPIETKIVLVRHASNPYPGTPLAGTVREHRDQSIERMRENPR